MVDKIAFGGGCHWCTEAVFESLKGVVKVEQGFVSATKENHSFSEAVIVHFNPDEIPLEVLVEIHLHTHKSTSNHSMRTKYRSAIYFFDKAQEHELRRIINELQNEFTLKIITKILEFKSFKLSKKQFLNYYYNNPDKPFCETYINPKLHTLIKRYMPYVNTSKLKLQSYESYKQS